jgi:hypothetical protein
MFQPDGVVSFFAIISPRWGFFSFSLGLLQLFHPDGVCFQPVCNCYKCFSPMGLFLSLLSLHPDGVSFPSVWVCYSCFTPMGFVFNLFVIAINVSARWGWFSFSSPCQLFSPATFDALEMVMLS